MGVPAKILNFVIPGWSQSLDSGRDLIKPVKNNLSRYISPVQLGRIKQDVQSWREAVGEAENAWYPHRVKMQRMYIDTILNGHVYSCMDRRKKLTMLKNYKVVDLAGNEDIKATQIIKEQWFQEYMAYALEAKAFGYSLIYLGDLVNDAFPDLGIIKRFNVSPDRLNITAFVYSISGIQFRDEPYADWHIWCKTSSDVGTSNCGFGYLYKVALYEILLRNTLGQNVDATEGFGMPTRVGKTNKSEESAERAIFENALANMGSAGYILMDAVGDEVELMESKSLGNGFKIYDTLETRLERTISKVILGHADAMDSTPGKLGGGQGQEESPVAQALRDTAVVDMNYITHLTNNELFPKLRNLGFQIGEDRRFVFDNNEEIKEIREEEDNANLLTAEVFQNIKLAGGDPDWTYFTQRTGIPVTKTEIPVMAPGLPGSNPADKGEKKPAPKMPAEKPKIKAALDKLYAGKKEKAN